MIWPQPLLHPSDLVAWRRPADEEMLLPPGYAGLRWHSGGAEALAALCAEQINARGDRPLNLWLPAYFCGQSLRYLRSLPLRFHFYALNEDLLPDYVALRQSSVNTAVDLLLHVHYFGRIAGQEQSRAFANEAGAMLIEDCAHVISPRVQRDWVGDYLVFAPHKLFALPRVGLVFSRAPFSGLGEPPDTKIPWGWCLRQLAKKILRRASASSWGLAWSGTTLQLTNHAPCVGTIRSASANLMNFTLAAAARCDHAKLLQEKLTPLSGWQPLPPANVAPYIFGMVCDSPTIARQRFSVFNRRVRLTMQWPDLPIEVRDQSQLAETCNSRVDRTLFFFVHQRLNTEHWLKEIEIAIKDMGLMYV